MHALYNHRLLTWNSTHFVSAVLCCHALCIHLVDCLQINNTSTGPKLQVGTALDLAAIKFIMSCVSHEYEHQYNKLTLYHNYPPPRLAKPHQVCIVSGQCAYNARLLDLHCKHGAQIALEASNNMVCIAKCFKREKHYVQCHNNNNNNIIIIIIGN